MTLLAHPSQADPAKNAQSGPVFRNFLVDEAPVVAGWVHSRDELFHLAPSTAAPLTADKVVAWTKAGGHAFVLSRSAENSPVIYGELNPIRNHPDQFWIGHVVTAPEHRGKGLGRVLLDHMVRVAFERLQASLVKLIVFPDNRPAIRCYERVGFFIAGHEFHRFPTVKSMQRVLRMELSNTRWASLRA